MSLFSQGYRETNQNQEVSDEEHSPIPGPLNTPDQTSYQPTPEIAPFDNRPPSLLNNNLDHLSPLIPPPDISPPSSTSSPPPTTNSSSSMSNLPPPSLLLLLQELSMEDKLRRDHPTYLILHNSNLLCP